MQPVIHYDYRLLRHTPAELRAEFAKLEWTRSQRLRTLAEIPVEVELRGLPEVPIYQRIAREADRLHDAGLTLDAIAEHFAVDDHTAAKAVRWFRQR